ncbi:hypothetical protein BTZ20_5669 [Rhodococcus sp. MTM3W5.2]|nr:hypothetical protein BTZ20_5669 [Rhodococcus sp. MTM3W5.2]
MAAGHAGMSDVRPCPLRYAPNDESGPTTMHCGGADSSGAAVVWG